MTCHLFVIMFPKSINRLVQSLVRNGVPEILRNKSDKWNLSLFNRSCVYPFCRRGQIKARYRTVYGYQGDPLNHYVTCWKWMEWKLIRMR